MLDLIIIGSGAAGLTAALYAKLYQLEAICIGDKLGGKLVTAPLIVDYPGVKGISGKDFISPLNTQLNELGVSVLESSVSTIVVKEGVTTSFTLTTTDQKSFEARTVLLCTGNPNKQSNGRTTQLAKQLALQEKMGLLVINNNFMTSRAGVFAAGDCLMYPFSLEQLTTTVASAVQATACIFEYIKSKHAPIVWGKAAIPRLFVERKTV